MNEMARGKRSFSKSVCFGYYSKGDKEIVDEVVPVRPICDEDTNKEFFSADPGNMVYHTANKRFIIHIRKALHESETDELKIFYDGQLITTSVVITFRGKSIRIDDVVLDTGSSHTVIN